MCCLLVECIGISEKNRQSTVETSSTAAGYTFKVKSVKKNNFFKWWLHLKLISYVNVRHHHHHLSPFSTFYSEQLVFNFLNRIRDFRISRIK